MLRVAFVLRSTEVHPVFLDLSICLDGLCAADPVFLDSYGWRLLRPAFRFPPFERLVLRLAVPSGDWLVAIFIESIL